MADLGSALGAGSHEGDVIGGPAPSGRELHEEDLAYHRDMRAWKWADRHIKVRDAVDEVRDRVEKLTLMMEEPDRVEQAAAISAYAARLERLIDAPLLADEPIAQEARRTIRRVIDRVRATLAPVLAAEQERQNLERDRRRQERLAARPTETVEMEERKCSRCNRKPARIDDLCKKCARDSGIVVHGKIGTGEEQIARKRKQQV